MEFLKLEQLLMPMIPLNSTTNTGQAITQAMNEFGNVSSDINKFNCLAK